MSQVGVIDAGALVEVLEAAEAAERKLWHEYRNDCSQCGVREPIDDRESWAEGERLRAALDRIRFKWQGELN